MKTKNISYLVRRSAIRSSKLLGVSLAAAITCALAAQVQAVPGDLYVSDLATNSILVYSPDGTSRVLASGFNQPQGLAFDPAKNLYVADKGTGTIFKVALDGTKTVFAAGLQSPIGVTFTENVLLVAENGGARVTSIPADDPTNSRLYQIVTTPIGVAAHASTTGNRYITNGGSVLKVDTDGSSTDIAPGKNSINVQVGSISDPATATDVFVSTGAGTVLKITPTGTTTTFASGFTQPTGMDFRPAKFSGDTNGVGDFYVADPATGIITVKPKTGPSSVFATDGGPNFIVFEVNSALVSPTPTPTVSPTASPTPTISPTPTPSPTATPSPNAGRLQNIATRADVQTGDNVLIGGFIIKGGTAPKSVLLRAIGPSLATGDNPIPDALADPVLELHKPDGSVITNNNWKQSQEAAITATGLAPTNDLESAILVSLFPENDINPTTSGHFTVVVRGNNGGTGVGVVEIYDLDDPATSFSELANISSRGIVFGTSQDVLIGGVIVGPAAFEESVLLRAIGPSLPATEVPAPLHNPTLTIYNQDGGIVGANDDWQNQDGGASALAAIEATGLAPANPKESAILADLPAGEYTAIVSGSLGGTGVALVEAYHIVATVAK